MARARHSFPTRGAKRATQWIAPADQNVIAVSSGGSSVIASFNAGDASFNSPTIVRTRGEVSVQPQAFGADLAIAGAFGAGIISADALVAGIGSIPTPFDDADWGGWYVWQSFSILFEFSDATGLLFPAGVSYQVDSKAMRKMTSNEVFVFVAQSQAGAFNISMPLRTLLKLA